MRKKIVILGGGESGAGAAILAQQQGYDVWVSDAGTIKVPYMQELTSRGIDYEDGGHSEERILEADEVIKSPGIPGNTPLLQQLRAKGIPVMSEIEFAYRYKGDSKIIAITGSNGKTTTSALTYHICKTGGANCALVGNIGDSFARQVALKPRALYIIEVSSFQLDDIIDFRPDIAVITNITEDHLDRYDYNFENYIRAKFNIIRNQVAGDSFIYNEDDPVTMKYMSNYPITSTHYPFTMNKEPQKGAFIKNGVMTLAAGNERADMSIYDFAVKGKHNLSNSMAAGLSAALVNIRKDKIREAMVSFENLEHRMETAGTIRGVKFINDSKATNVNSAWYALESMETPVVLILGGVDKGNDYNEMMDLVKEKVKAIVCLGTDNRKIHEAFSKTVSVIVNTTSAAEAVQAAFHLAAKGDTVLLSPACASFDLFKNYEDRGRQFKAAVRDL